MDGTNTGSKPFIKWTLNDVQCACYFIKVSYVTILLAFIQFHNIKTFYVLSLVVQVAHNKMINYSMQNT